MIIKTHKFLPIRYEDISVHPRMVVKIYQNNHLIHCSYFMYSHSFDNCIVKELYLKEIGKNEYLEVHI